MNDLRCFLDLSEQILVKLRAASMSIKLIVRYNELFILILYDSPHLRSQSHVEHAFLFLVHVPLPILLAR